MIDQIGVADKPCQCGALSLPGSAFCGDDCTPTHIVHDAGIGPGLEEAYQLAARRWADDLLTHGMVLDDEPVTLTRG